jgi:hypothetical protein
MIMAHFIVIFSTPDINSQDAKVMHYVASTQQKSWLHKEMLPTCYSK